MRLRGAAGLVAVLALVFGAVGCRFPPHPHEPPSSCDGGEPANDEVPGVELSFPTYSSTQVDACLSGPDDVDIYTMTITETGWAVVLCSSDGAVEVLVDGAAGGPCAESPYGTAAAGPFQARVTVRGTESTSSDTPYTLQLFSDPPI